MLELCGTKWVLKERGTERERNEFQFKSWWNGTELVPKFCKWNGTELVPKKLERSTRLGKCPKNLHTSTPKTQSQPLTAPQVVIIRDFFPEVIF